MTREAILNFVRDYIVREDRPPSVRTIAEAVLGVDRASFYNFFASKHELLNALGIEPEESDLPKAAAMEAKKKAAEKGGDYHITLNQTQSEKLIAIAYMEGKTTSMVVDEILEEQRQVRQIMIEVNGGTLDSETISAILDPELVYEGWNVSQFAGKPWIKLNCNRCGDPVFIGEEIGFNRWLFEFMPAIRKITKITCADCMPKPPVYTRILA